MVILNVYKKKLKNYKLELITIFFIIYFLSSLIHDLFNGYNITRTCWFYLNGIICITALYIFHKGYFIILTIITEILIFTSELVYMFFYEQIFYQNPVFWVMILLIIYMSYNVYKYRKKNYGKMIIIHGNSIYIHNLKLTFYKSFYIRLFFVVGLNILYYSWHWNPLVTILGETLEWMYRNLLGLDTSFHLPGYTGDLQGVSRLSRSCLYIELYAYILPFLYDRTKSILKNLTCIITLFISIQFINIMRIFISVWWRISYDVPRWLYHDLPDTLIWYPICIGIMLYGAFKLEPVSIELTKIGLTFKLKRIGKSFYLQKQQILNFTNEKKLNEIINDK